MRSTPLRDLPGLAQQAGLDAMRLKDEATRFGLGSFKALGGAYAVVCVLATALARHGLCRGRRCRPNCVNGGYRDVTEGITVTCATDGNHGRCGGLGRAALPLPVRDLRPRGA